MLLILYLLYKLRQNGMYGGPTYLLFFPQGTGVEAEIRVHLISLKATSELCL